jgi:hypothetical protein
MSNLSNQSGSGHSTSMEMNMGPSTSQGQDQHSEGKYRFFVTSVIAAYTVQTHSFT